ncbi:MAG: HlyC/CorC family transporter [Deltaproteobacteria bacterium]|nr:HlyC/CorC family transporter [Deltaproteobacteria bacterium]
MWADLFSVLIILALVGANGVFVAAEFSLVGAPRAVIQGMATSGHRAAGQIQAILTEPRRQDHYIATAQIGITLASLGLGMYGEPLLASWFATPLRAIGAPTWLVQHSATGVLAIGVLTFLHILVGEMIPKALALAAATKTAIRLLPLMNAAKIVFLPLVFGLNGIGNGLLRLVGIRRAESVEQITTPEEIQMIVEESAAEGLIRSEAGRVLTELIEFGDLFAHEVMVPRVHVAGVPVGCDTAKLKTIIAEDPHTRYPVFQDDLDHILGMVHIKDLLRIVLAGRTVSKGDARPVPRIPESTELDTVLDIMRREEAQAVLVMDEHGGTAGLITMEDLFEEVVGEIEEDAAEPPEIRRENDGRVRVRGTVRLQEAGDALDRALAHEDVDTISGLVLTLLQRPPEVGDIVRYVGLRFTVTRVEGHGVEECIVEVDPDPLPPPRLSSTTSRPPPPGPASSKT